MWIEGWVRLTALGIYTQSISCLHDSKIFKHLFYDSIVTTLTLFTHTPSHTAVLMLELNYSKTQQQSRNTHLIRIQGVRCAARSYLSTSLCTFLLSVIIKSYLMCLRELILPVLRLLILKTTCSQSSIFVCISNLHF